MGSLPLSSPGETHGGALIAKEGQSSDQLGLVLALVLDSVPSPYTKRQYARALLEFAQWRAGRRLPFTRATVNEWRSGLETQGLAAATVNQKLAAVRKLAREAAANGLLESGLAAGIVQIPGVKQRGTRTGNWLTKQQAQALIEAPEPNTLKGKRDRCALAMLVGCGLRRAELASLTFEHIQQREGRWMIIDLRGKGNRIRSVPVPNWVKVAMDHWCAAAQITGGRILRGMNKYDQITHETISGTAILDLAVKYGNEIGVSLKAHDLRRTCAKLCRKHGGELEQIQLLLGHASIQTTERYLGTKQDLTNAPNDRMGLRWRDE
jgi:integrase